MIRIRRLGPNNVVKETVLYDSESNGKEVVVHIESYGKERLDREVLINADEKTTLTALDPVKDKADMLANNKKIKDELIIIQEKMDE